MFKTQQIQKKSIYFVVVDTSYVYRTSLSYSFRNCDTLLQGVKHCVYNDALSNPIIIIILILRNSRVRTCACRIALWKIFLA